jgi:putative phosphoribosyl transferase
VANQRIGGLRMNSLHSSVEIPAGAARLQGDLHVPHDARGVVLFAHGSGSSRHSPRNRFVAQTLQQAGLATVLLDLLTEPEESLDQRTGHLRFDIDLLSGRLVHATRWALQQPSLGGLRIGYFGASTGAAAALVAAAEIPEIAAVVSRGGRPDLAGAALDRVYAPVLLMVGGADHTVLNLNRHAMTRLTGEKKLEIVPGATHLFEEPGALEQVARLASLWFDQWLVRTP